LRPFGALICTHIKFSMNRLSYVLERKILTGTFPHLLSGDS
jgi:hypothetical protein